jgi:AMIN domain
MQFRVKAVRFRCFLMTGCLGLCSVAAGQSNNPVAATIERVEVLSHGNSFEMEIEASRPVTPSTQAVAGPDRLVIDFPNSVPGPRLRAIAVNALHVKGIRMGLFASNPPVARVVVDLTSAQAYQVFPSGKSVIVKITAGGNTTAVLTPVSTPLAPAAAAPSLPPPLSAPVKPVPAVQVEFTNGMLSVRTERATLGEVLRAIGRQIGARVSLAPSAEQEPVIANLGPAPAREVLSLLLKGVPYNVMLIGSGRDLSKVTSIVLTPRTAETGSMPANYVPAPAEETPPPEPEVEPAPPPVEQETPPPPDTVPPPPQ